MESVIHLDALVVGAGVSGIYSSYRLRQMNLTFRCIDIASDLGGTWFWNRYPGAMSDTESYLYRYSWDKDDLQTYPWARHYVYQPEILAYLHHVVQKHELGDYMQFNTEILSAKWDDQAKHWHIMTSTGKTFIVRYFISCLGVLSKANYPDIPGIQSFQGDITHTSNWDPELDLSNKRVGIIGNGSTGVQVMTAIAPIVKKLTSFQRTPQYSVPSGQGTVSSEYREKINKTYDEIWEGVWNSSVGFGVPESTRKTMSVSAEERQAVFQSLWDQGNGFRFMFSGFGDITTDEQANEEACNFIRSKIREIVKDPRKAKILQPTELYARRPLCDTGYYQIFNRDNVDIVDLKDTPISEVIPSGIKLSDGTTHELDALILATGFDVIDGNFTRIIIRGRNNISLKDHWAEGTTAYGGIACNGFPNMFIVAGPQGVFANFPPVVEAEVNFVFSCIQQAESNIASGSGRTIMEASKEAEQGWGDLCEQLAEGSLFKKTSSWIFGLNIPGRKETTKFYFGGLKKYADYVEDVISRDFKGFVQG